MGEFTKTCNQCEFETNAPAIAYPDRQCPECEHGILGYDDE